MSWRCTKCQGEFDDVEAIEVGFGEVDEDGTEVLVEHGYAPLCKPCAHFVVENSTC